MGQKFEIGRISMLACLTFISIVYMQDFAVDTPTTIATTTIETKADPMDEEIKLYLNISGYAMSRSEEIHGRSTVILTYATYNYRLLLLNFIMALRKHQIFNYGIVCLDGEIHTFLADRGFDCFQIDLDSHFNSTVSNEAMKSTSSSPKQKKKLNEKKRVQKVHKVWLLRALHLQELLSAGLDVVFSDVDAIWVKNPFETGLFTANTADIVSGRGKFPWDVADAWGATLCMGVIYFHSNSAVIELVNEMVIDTHKSGDDQKSLNTVLFDWGGNKPKKIFGFRLALKNKEPANAVVTSKNKPFRELRFRVEAHGSIPRFCNLLTEGEWERSVNIAHCHHNDGKISKNMQNWGNDDVRVHVLAFYDLWCIPSEWSDKIPLPEDVVDQAQLSSENREGRFNLWLDISSKSDCLSRFIDEQEDD